MWICAGIVLLFFSRAMSRSCWYDCSWSVMGARRVGGRSSARFRRLLGSNPEHQQIEIALSVVIHPSDPSSSTRNKSTSPVAQPTRPSLASANIHIAVSQIAPARSFPSRPLHAHATRQPRQSQLPPAPERTCSPIPSATHYEDFADCACGGRTGEAAVHTAPTLID